MADAKPVPDGRGGAIPYLHVRDAARAIEFYKRAFGAVELERYVDGSGKVGHAELKIGEALFMLSDEFPSRGVHSPQALGGSPVTIHLYVEDVDRLAEQALAAGAKVLRPVADQFYGDRGGKLEDPFGHCWWLATHKEDLTVAELERRVKAVHE